MSLSWLADKLLLTSHERKGVTKSASSAAPRTSAFKLTSTRQSTNSRASAGNVINTPSAGQRLLGMKILLVALPALCKQKSYLSNCFTEADHRICSSSSATFKMVARKCCLIQVPWHLPKVTSGLSQERSPMSGRNLCMDGPPIVANRSRAHESVNSGMPDRQTEGVRRNG